jgi:hypothetical protein
MAFRDSGRPFIFSAGRIEWPHSNADRWKNKWLKNSLEFFNHCSIEASPSEITQYSLTTFLKITK